MNCRGTKRHVGLFTAEVVYDATSTLEDFCKTMAWTWGWKWKITLGERPEGGWAAEGVSRGVTLRQNGNNSINSLIKLETELFLRGSEAKA